MPEVEDDLNQADAGAPDINAGAEDYSDAESDEAEPSLSARERAVLQYRKARDKQLGKADSDDDDSDDLDRGADEPVDDAPVAQKAEAPAARSVAPPAAAKPDPSIEASNALIEAARTLVEEVKSIRSGAARPANEAAEDDGQDDPEEAPAAPAVDHARLEEIVERIQIGDRAEGREALAELIELIGANKQNAGLKSDDVAQVVQSHIARDRIVGELSSAATSFREKFSGVVDDPDLLDTSIRRLNAELREDLVKAGVPEKDLARATPDQLMEMHQQARITGRQMRGYGAIFDKVGSEIATKFRPLLQAKGQPRIQDQQATIQQRVDRKRQLGAQPRPASVRNQQSQPKPKTRAEVVADMRRQRGFAS
jgi:hypothetical protein